MTGADVNSEGVSGAAVIGVDAGGTRTRAALVTPDGDCAGWAAGGPGNPNSAGAELAAASIADVCSRLLAANPDVDLRLVAVTMAGGSATGGRIEGLAEALAAVGITAPVELRGDQLGAYFAGTWQPDGGVLIAGTGAVGALVKGGELADVIDGCGWLVGDDGSGFWIGRRVAHAALADIDGRGPATELTRRVLDRVGTVTQPSVAGDPRRAALVRWSYARRPVQLSELAPLAFELAALDPVAQAIIEDAARQLVNTVQVVARRAGERTPVVLAGSVATSGSAITAALLDALGDRARTSADGTVGAATVALRLAGHDVAEATWQRLQERVGSRRDAIG